ncbi:MAG: class I SAM-dependent rRNA methyltransferase [Rikenellaceae bacterium]
MAKLYLKKGKESSLQRRHPWLFSGAIELVDSDGELAEGEVVEIYSKAGDFLAVGHYQVGSIAVRILSFEQEVIDAQWWRDRVQAAYELRVSLALFESEQTTCYRLIHGEGDSLPGLVVDIYGDVAVVQCHSIGMYLSRDVIAQSIVDVYGGKIKAVYNKSAKTLPFNSGVSVEDGYLVGEGSSSRAEVLENGHKFMVNWERGQKTGFFIDQRFNRQLVGQYSAGRTVLNTFCYTGGFSVYALAGGAKEVCSVDSSEHALHLAQENVELNFGEDSRHSTLAVDAVEYLKNIGDKYDLIILDPPAFAKNQRAISSATQAYRRLNARAISQIKSGGILFTFSCSQAISKELFRTTLFSAAAIAGRKVRILHQLSQPADHPINIYHPEGEYLKGLVVYVE